MADYKVGRLSSDIQRIVSGKLRDLKDPRLNSGMLTVVKVDVSGDRSVARVYVSSFEGIEKAKEAVKGLDSAAGFLRREIANVLHIRRAPELRFIADDSTEYSAHIAKVIKDLDLKYDDEESVEQE